MRKMRNGYFSLLLLFFSLSKGLSQIPATQLQDTLDYYRPIYNITGVSAAIRFPDGTIWTGTSGWSDTINGTPIDTNMLFAIGSITKTYTTTIVMKLMEQGLIGGLMDSLGSYLSLNHPNIDESITLRQLFDHTSGLYDYVTDTPLGIAVWSDLTYWWPPDSPLAYVKAPYFAPGNGFKYSNTNYLLLGLIAKNLLSVDTLGAYLRDSILYPHGFQQTYFYPEMDIPANVPIAHPHFDINGTPQSQEDVSMYPRIAIHSVAWAAGCIYATAKDVTLFISKLFHNQILSASSINLMTQFNPYNYGLGVARGYYNGYEIWAHDGAILGYTTIYLYIPTLDLTLCLFTNNNFANVNDYALKLLDVAMTYVLTHVDTKELPPHWKLMPNPARTDLSIYPLLSPTSYEIVSIDGKVMKSGILTPEQSHIDISHFSQGLYLIRLSNGQYHQVLRFIKMD